MLQISVAKFKTACLKLLQQVRKTRAPIGTALYAEPSKLRSKSYGAMKATLRGPVGDLIAPLDEITWDALGK